MLEHYFRSLRVRTRIRNSPVREPIERLVEHLHMRGHRTLTIQQYVQAALHFGRWLSACRGKSLVITRESILAFVERHLPHCSCSLPAPRSVKTARAALHHLLRAMPSRSVGEIDTDTTPEARLVQEYVEHLDLNCGLALATRSYRARYAREFLESQASRGTHRLNDWTPQDVMRFAAGYASKCKRSSAQVAACSLRSFLRFLHLRGLCDRRLVQAVPRIPQWRREGLPRVMMEEQLGRFLGSFRHASATGHRDYAMALYMVELGLRVSEVVELELDDIDWRNGTVCIRSAKDRRTRLLPLSSRVGKATASYLNAGRPSSSYRRVFLRHSVPVGTPVTRELVRGIVRRAYARSGCPSAWTGTHILRHTAATRLLQRGVNLKEIADLLGHQSIDTSAIYTKVDLPALASVALPWPEEQR